MRTFQKVVSRQLPDEEGIETVVPSSRKDNDRGSGQLPDEEGIETPWPSFLLPYPGSGQLPDEEGIETSLDLLALRPAQVRTAT